MLRKRENDLIIYWKKQRKIIPTERKIQLFFNNEIGKYISEY